MAFLGLSFVPFLLGMTGTFSFQMTAFGEIARNPSATAADLAAGIYMSSIPLLIGAFVSVLSVCVACLLMTAGKEEDA